MKKVKILNRADMEKYAPRFDAKKYPVGTRFPVTFSLPHDDGPDVRCLVETDVSEVRVTLPLDVFNKLPYVEVEE